MNKLLGACLLLASQDRLRARIVARQQDGVAHHHLRVAELAAVFGAGVYGGYFGAGLGIILVAVMGLVSDLPFDMFMDAEGGIDGYAPESADLQVLENQLVKLQKKRKFSWKKTFHPSQNWNEIWESNFEPVVVEDWVGVRADFHAPIANVQHELVINPKMAFGTGHHETTWMCLHTMRGLDFKGKKVLDYGCGSGILSILASKMGASEIEAVDIEEESYLNTAENAKRNGVSNITALHGQLDAVKSTDFDIVLANINRNVILDSLFELSQMVKPGGWLIASGFLKEDEMVVVDVAWRVAFILTAINEKTRETEAGKMTWLCLLFEKR